MTTNRNVRGYGRAGFYPKRALSDGAQQLTPAVFGEMMAMLRPFAELMGRTMG